jgi:hypothetical protein
VRRLAAIAAALLIAGCGGEASSSTEAETPAAPTTTQRKPPPAAEALRISCPAGVADCETASGEILYVERVDADGDGDAHFVLLSRESITAPGISVIDVRTDLRPHPLPGPGDLFAGAGPVYEGSYGQSQIQAEAVEFRREP